MTGSKSFTTFSITIRLLNSFIEQQQINFNVVNNVNHNKVVLTSNLPDLDMNTLFKNEKEVICIITNDDYKSLINLMYNDEKKIINYNNDYYILEIKPYMEFESNINNLHNIQNTFKNL